MPEAADSTDVLQSAWRPEATDKPLAIRGRLRCTFLGRTWGWFPAILRQASAKGDSGFRGLTWTYQAKSWSMAKNDNIFSGRKESYGHGSKPKSYSPVNIPIPTKIGFLTWVVNSPIPKWDPKTVLHHGHLIFCLGPVSALSRAPGRAFFQWQPVAELFALAVGLLG